MTTLTIPIAKDCLVHAEFEINCSGKAGEPALPRDKLD